MTEEDLKRICLAVWGELIEKLTQDLRGEMHDVAKDVVTEMVYNGTRTPVAPPLSLEPTREIK